MKKAQYGEDAMIDAVASMMKWDEIASEDQRIEKLFRGEIVTIDLKQTIAKELISEMVFQLDEKMFRQFFKRIEERFLQDLVGIVVLLHAIQKRVNRYPTGRINIDDILEVVQDNFGLDRDDGIFYAVFEGTRKMKGYKRLEASVFANAFFQQGPTPL